jgi:aryl-alcohol dehydrogenase-like predicted oxidoreductase
MRYANLGRTELQLSKLALGTMTFGTGPGFGTLRPKVDAALARRMVHAAIDHGVTLFDSAGGYNEGSAEAFLGEALQTRRDEVLISTKDAVVHEAQGGGVRNQIRANVQASLRRLGTDTIDIYHVGLRHLDQPLDGVIEGLDDVVRAGLVRHTGVTNLTSWQLDRLARAADAAGLARLGAAQLSYSLLERHIEHEYVPLLSMHGIGVLAWSPLAGGFLTGKYTPKDPDGAGGRLATFRLQPLEATRGFIVVERLREIAAGYGVSPAAAALAWTAAKPFISSVLVGATSMANLLDNLAAADLTLTDEDLLALDDISATPAAYPYWLYSGG